MLLHLERIGPGLAVGKSVKRGQEVARSGNTGRSTAPHLHYQLEQANGRVLDPFKVHSTWREGLPAREVEGMRARLRELESYRAKTS